MIAGGYRTRSIICGSFLGKGISQGWLVLFVWKGRFWVSGERGTDAVL